MPGLVNDPDPETGPKSASACATTAWIVMPEPDLPLISTRPLDRKRLSHHLSTKDNIYWHPNLDMPGIEFHTGSLGHGLTIGIGMAFESKIIKKNNKTIVVMGDGELNEGSVWESLLIANAYQLKNLIVIVDRNLRQANKTTEDLIPLEPLNEKFASHKFSLLIIG